METKQVLISYATIPKDGDRITIHRNRPQFPIQDDHSDQIKQEQAKIAESLEEVIETFQNLIQLQIKNISIEVIDKNSHINLHAIPKDTTDRDNVFSVEELHPNKFKTFTDWFAFLVNKATENTGTTNIIPLPKTVTKTG